MWSDRGYSFGKGNDFTLHNCLHNNNSYNNCPSTFQTEKYELNGGEYKYIVKDYEVYSINFKYLISFLKEIIIFNL